MSGLFTQTISQSENGVCNSTNNTNNNILVLIELR